MYNKLIFSVFLFLAGSVDANHNLWQESPNWLAVDLLSAPGASVKAKLPGRVDRMELEAQPEYNLMRVVSFEYLATRGMDDAPPMDLESTIEIVAHDYRMYHHRALQGEIPRLYEVLEQEVPNHGNRVTTYPKETRFLGFPAAEYYQFDWAGHPTEFGMVFLVKGVLYRVEWRIQGVDWEVEAFSIRDLFTRWQKIKEGISVSGVTADASTDPKGWRFDDAEFFDKVHRNAVVKQFEDASQGQQPHSEKFAVEMYEAQERFDLKELDGLPRYFSKNYTQQEGEVTYHFVESTHVGGSEPKEALMRSGSMLRLALEENEKIKTYQHLSTYGMPLLFAEAGDDERTKVIAMVMDGDKLYTLALDYPNGAEVKRQWERFLDSFVFRLQALHEVR